MTPGGDPDAPLGPAELDAAFAPLADASRILVAVSGGPDSTALMHLLAGWVRRAAAPTLAVATVDHGLRSGARGEAEAVGSQAAALGLPHAILAWDGRKGARVSQEAAREARYGLLAAHAREIGASHLVTGHTLDDQAETVLMRMAAGSGLSGLAAMRAVVTRGDMIHARPFLPFPKARLVATCRDRGWRFAADPSNADPRFGRTRWRGVMPRLAAEGLDAARLARLAARLARADAALDAVAFAVGDRVSRREGRAVVLDMGELARGPDEIALRAVRRVVAASGEAAGNPGHLRLERLESCVEALLGAARSGGALRRTLAGHVLHLAADGSLRIEPEAARRRGRADR